MSKSASETTSPKPFRISRLVVQEALDTAHGAYEECWHTLSSIRDGKIGKLDRTSIIDFQPKLTDALLSLETLYRTIKKEEKRLISRKRKYKYQWFSRRMAALSMYAESIRNGLSVGRAIGDAFAWYFYERDRSLIIEHLSHQRQPLFPPRIGGLGERLTLKNMQGFDGKFLIYHGNTTFLRMGDVSFIDMETMRVACIAELKTKRVDEEHISVEMVMVTINKEYIPNLTEYKFENREPVKLTRAMIEKRDRQITDLSKTLAKVDKDAPDQSISLQSDFHYSELDEIVASAHKRRFEFKQAGPGLIIGALRMRHERLGKNFMQSNINTNKILDNANKAALQILDAKLDYNSLTLTHIGQGERSLLFGPEGMPFLVWPAKSETLRQIIFGEVIVITMFNRAHFFAEIESRGFHISLDEKKRLRIATRRFEGKEMQLEKYEYFSNMMQFSLMSQESVLKMVDQSIEVMLAKHTEGAVRVELRPLVHRVRPVKFSASKRVDEK